MCNGTVAYNHTQRGAQARMSSLFVIRSELPSTLNPLRSMPNFRQFQHLMCTYSFSKSQTVLLSCFSPHTRTPSLMTALTRLLGWRHFGGHLRRPFCCISRASQAQLMLEDGFSQADRKRGVLDCGSTVSFAVRSWSE